jgi:hypothetical protein
VRLTSALPHFVVLVDFNVLQNVKTSLVNPLALMCPKSTITRTTHVQALYFNHVLYLNNGTIVVSMAPALQCGIRPHRAGRYTIRLGITLIS